MAQNAKHLLATCLDIPRMTTRKGTGIGAPAWVPIHACNSHTRMPGCRVGGLGSDRSCAIGPTPCDGAAEAATCATPSGASSSGAVGAQPSKLVAALRAPSPGPPVERARGPRRRRQHTADACRARRSRGCECVHASPLLCFTHHPGPSTCATCCTRAVAISCRFRLARDVGEPRKARSTDFR